MKELRKSYIAKHREMWNWLANNPDKGKASWPGWSKTSLEKINHCFLCGYVQKVPHGDCSNCPLDWGITTMCVERHPGDSYYYLYQEATTPTDRAKYAKIIANLPERDNIMQG